MKLFFPNNIFASLIAKNLSGNDEIKFVPSSMLSKHLTEDEESAALIPTTDLINHNDLYVSKKFGVSFEGEISNSYIYFKPGEPHINEISLYGDVSSLEVIITKILFKEVYGADVVMQILTDESNLDNKNLVVIGDQNFSTGIFSKGISFADEVTESLDLPFVNFIAASRSSKIIEELDEKTKNITAGIYTSIETANIGEKYSSEVVELFKANSASLIFELDEQDVEGITQLVRLPYFHGITKDIFELKFV